VSNYAVSSLSIVKICYDSDIFYLYFQIKTLNTQATYMIST